MKMGGLHINACKCPVCNTSAVSMPIRANARIAAVAAALIQISANVLVVATLAGRMQTRASARNVGSSADA